MRNIIQVKLIFMLMFFCFGKTLLAQLSISGKIYDENSNPIGFANIILEDTLQNKFIKGKVTDENGYFEINTEITGAIKICVQYIGYEKWGKIIQNDAPVYLGEINLVPAASNLEQITVTADRPTIEKINDKLVFNVSSSPLKSGYDGMEVLQRSPNIWIGENGQILMRNESAIVMVNGRRINMAGSDLANYIGNLQSDEIKSIEIQTNASAKVDAENSGGIINIILKRKKLGWNGITRLERMENGHGLYRNFGAVNFNYGSPTWNFYGNYNYNNRLGGDQTVAEIFYYNSGNYLKNNEQFEREDDAHRFRIGAVTDIGQRHQIGAEYYGRFGNYDVLRESDFSMTNVSGVIDEGIIIGETAADNFTANGTFNYQWKLDTLNSQFKIVGDYTRYEFDDDTEIVSEYKFDVYEDLLERNQFKANTGIYVAKADLIKNLSKGIKLETGAKFTNITRGDELLSTTFQDELWVVNDRTASINYDEKITAGYATVGKNISENTFVKIGLRVENTNLSRFDVLENDLVTQNYNNWFPSFYLSRKLKQGHTISASFSRRLRRPNFVSLGSKVVKINDFNYRAGNPGLRPEYFGKYDLSYLVRKHHVSLYFNHVKDAINGIYLLDGEVTTYQQFNNGYQRQHGLVYNWTGNLFDWWYFSPSANIFHRKFINEENISMFEQTSFAVRVSNNFKINTTTSIDFSARYISSRKDAFYESASRYEANIIFKKSFLNKKLNASIYLHDMFNTRRFINRRPFPDFETRNNRNPRSTGVTFYLTYHFSNNNKTSNKTNKSGNDAVNRLRG